MSELGATGCDVLAALLAQRRKAENVQCTDEDSGCDCNFSSSSPGGSFESSTYSTETGLFGPTAITFGYCLRGDLLHVITRYQNGSMITQDLFAVRQ